METAQKRVVNGVIKMGNALQFDKNGNVIVPGPVKADKEEEKRSIIFKRIQVRQNNPAIAQLKITLPYDIPSAKEIKNTFEMLANRFQSVGTSMRQIDSRNFVFEARETWLMYSFLQTLEKELEDMFRGDIKIFKRGYWPKFDN
jgi:hypothetical protein